MDYGSYYLYSAAMSTVIHSVAWGLTLDSFQSSAKGEGFPSLHLPTFELNDLNKAAAIRSSFSRAVSAETGRKFESKHGLHPGFILV